MDDPTDPYFDADDLSHNLFATGYELDQEGLAVTVGGLARDEPGDLEGASLVDQDSLGRAVGLPVPDRDDVDAAAARDIQSARRALRRPAGGRGPDEGVRGVSPIRDPEREAAADEPDGASDSAGGGDDRARIAAYLANPRATKTQENLRKKGRGKDRVPRKQRKPTFDGAEFEVEIFSLSMVPSGSWKLTLMVPPESRDEVLKLSTTSGLLLKASVSTVEGVIK